LELKYVPLQEQSTAGRLLTCNQDTIDSDGGVWLSSFNANVLARLDTTTFKYTYVPFPDTLAKVDDLGLLSMVPPNVDVAVTYGPGNAIWFTSVARNSVIRYDLS
jgi:streptogramin lyase